MTTTLEVSDLVALAEDLGLSIVERRGHHRGGYHDGIRQIRLNPRLSSREVRSVLAHEVAHALYRDIPTPYGPARMKQEARAWGWAAQHLVAPEQFAEVERIRDGHAASMAYDLRVTIEVVEAYRRALLRTDEAVYVRPRIGTGQYSLKQRIAS